MGVRRKMDFREEPYADCGEDMEYPQGIKWTKQRKDVFKVLWESAEPLTAIRIYNEVESRKEGGDYAVSTIYRILAAFEEKGLVERSSGMGDGTALYCLNRGGHTHYAVCLGCRKRVPLKGCPFARFIPEGESGDLADFTVTGHKLEIYGYCSVCGGLRKG